MAAAFKPQTALKSSTNNGVKPKLKAQDPLFRRKRKYNEQLD
jgi:hypothetical protein